MLLRTIQVDKCGSFFLLVLNMSKHKKAKRRQEHFAQLKSGFSAWFCKVPSFWLQFLYWQPFRTGGSATTQLFLDSCNCCPEGKHWAEVMAFCRHRQPQHKVCWAQLLPPENFLLLHWTPITEALLCSLATNSRPLLSLTSCCSSSPKLARENEGQGQIVSPQQILLTSLRKAETVSLPISAVRKHINNPRAFKSVMKKTIINRAEILNLSMKTFHAMNILAINIHWTWKLTKTAAGWKAQLGHPELIYQVHSSFT